MGLLRQFLVITVVVVVIGVSSSTAEQPEQPKTTITSTSPPPPVSSSTEKPLDEVKETQEDSVMPIASIGNVETPAVVEEVPHDWTDGVVPPESDSAERANASNTDDYLARSYQEYSEYPEDYYYDYGYEYDDYETHATQEDFHDNVPQSLHDDTDIIINRDNLVPITKTLILAITGKENPTYAELLKAGGITAFKTSLKHLGDEKLGVNLLALAKKLTNMWGDSDGTEGDDKEEGDDMLRSMAEDFLASHRFKLVLPESILLHEAELKELLDKRMKEPQVEGRSASTEMSHLTIFTPRATTTLMALDPLPWLAALFSGLVAVPFFMGDDTPSPVARADRPGRLPPRGLPFRQLRPPGLPFIRNPQLRRDETNAPLQNQPVDNEFLEYKKKYAQWYNQWYLKHKEYYDKNYPFNSQPQGPIRPPQAGPAQRQPPRPANVPPRHPRPPPQRPRKPAQNPKRPPPQARVPSKRRRVRPGRPIPPVAGVPPRPALPQSQGARNSAQSSSISAIAEPHPNAFGTFLKEDNHGDSHFRVFRGQDDVTTSTTTTTARPPAPKVPKVPSPQPVYIPTTKAPPTTETGFKPIIKPDAPVEDNAGAARGQIVSESVHSPKQVKPNFRPPKQDDLLEKTKPAAVPKKPGSPPTDVQLAPGGFKPIPGLANVSPLRPEPESTTRKVSVITSSIFKTAPTTQAPPKTPAAVFFRTATEKSVRVVTSSSFVTQPAPQLPQKQALQDVRPQPHQEPQSLDGSANLQAEESKPTVVIEAVPAGPQFLRSTQEAPADAREPNVRSRGAVRTNVPAHIRVVDHRDHRRPQGFGLGPKPEDASNSPDVPSDTTAGEPEPSIPTTTAVPIFALDPFYGSRLSRIDVIFHQLKVEGEGCREQVVCNIYKNPEVYTPFSDFLSRQLTVTLEELRRPKVSDERILRFFRYLKAARDGQDGVDCLARYPKCAQDTTSLSHKPILTTYQKVSRLMDASSPSS